MLRKIDLRFYRFYDFSVRAFKESILKLLEEDPKAKLLDCGCGGGEFTLECAKKIGTSKVYGIEIDKKAAEEAKRKGIKVYNEDLNKKLPLRSSFVDVIIETKL